MTNDFRHQFWKQQIQTSAIVCVGVVIAALVMIWIGTFDLDMSIRIRGLILAGLISGVLAPLGSAYAIRQNSRHLALHMQYERLANSDDLTGLANRRCFNRRGAARLAGAGRKQIALLLVDIDWFKRVNDMHGHEAGDDVLCHVAQTLIHASPDGALIARLGGEEFTVMCEISSHAELTLLAEKLRRATEATHIIYHGEPIRVTISLGLAIARPGDTLSALLSRADKALYGAKDHGRNQFSVAA
ncbi:GGDEF domain-containing protein [Hyphomonas oceanitis]|uniref:diguanylate cyclase n=1 Tax=Hyphomonas oceanitis SCH89 TaxID=1280953 RepID=A0A059G9E5_9PROT|nr:GGDEF domain-containing protein [Hyphomonas oceanitis]KDA03210.1 diguanylate cyclase [Hyphomonas oceanitis SCH89]